MSGSGGPSKVDADLWKNILCSKSFGKHSVHLCQSIANVTKRLCQEDIPSTFLQHLLSCRLIPLKKDSSGVRPIGIGEVPRRLMAKSVAKILKNDIQTATGSLQTCSGLDGGIEATVHAMSKAYNDPASEGLLLVDADNAFNSLNRATALSNIKSLCPPFYTFLNNTYKGPSKLFVSNSEEMILSQEGTTQGDPDAMPMYAIATRPIIDQQNDISDTSITKQSWYADDSAAASTLVELKKWWLHLCEIGPSYGYYPKPSKSILIVKAEHFDTAKALFQDTDLIITSEGQRHLGAVVGTNEFKNKFIDSKVKSWVSDVEELAKIAEEEPQLAFAAYTRGLCQRWTYIQRTIPDTAGNFKPLETAIKDHLIPALIGRPATPLERAILALPVRFGGLGLQDPSKTGEHEYSASVKVTQQLTELIYQQERSLSSLDLNKLKHAKNEIQLEKDIRFRKELKEVMEEADPLTQRSLEAAKEKGASSWLTALPLKRFGFILNKQEFRDAIALRYNWHIPDIPKFCGCGQKNDVVHVLSCKKGGYVSMRHDSLRDTMANMMREAGCTDVRTEPPLLPVNPNDFGSRCNTAEGARLDISARGLKSTFERTFYDVRVSHPYAMPNVTVSLKALYDRNEKEKRDLYEERVLQTEKGSFEPLVFLTTGGTGPACSKVIKHIAGKISERKGEEYSHVIGFMRTRLCFALLRSVLISVRGVRGKVMRDPPINFIPFNLIPTCEPYEC